MRRLATRALLTLAALLTLTVVTVCAPHRAAADSPLSELSAIAETYSDLPQVNDARLHGVISPPLADFLRGDAPLDHKAAVIAALGIRPDHATGSDLLRAAIAKAHGKPLNKLSPDDLSPAEQFSLGLTLALERWEGTSPLGFGDKRLRALTPQALLDAAATARPDSFTAAYASALTRHQDLSDFCAVYKAAAEVVARFPTADKRDMRPDAFDPLHAYLQGYAEHCPDTPEGRAAELSALNQHYQVLRVGPHLLTATQGGAVLWDPAQIAAPIAIAPANICPHAVARSGQAWIGCYDKLLHYDGAAFSVLASTQADDADGYRPLLAPDGDVLVYRAGQAWRVQGRDLKPLPSAPPDARAYNSLIRANGERWAIDFLDGLQTPKGFWPKGSAQYPGTDPRRLYEDPSGRLWVEDFERGAFLLSDDGAAFTHQPGLDSQCTGVAPDPTRGRLWLLHYREGLRLVSGGKVAAKVDLTHLGYMRALTLDPDGSLWVAGWSQLAHVTEQPDGSWQATPYLVRSLPKP